MFFSFTPNITKQLFWGCRAFEHLQNRSPSHEAKVRDTRVGRDPAFQAKNGKAKNILADPFVGLVLGKLLYRMHCRYISVNGGSNMQQASRLVDKMSGLSRAPAWPSLEKNLQKIGTTPS